MSKRWSKLQKDLYNIISKDLNFQIHCSVYRMESQRGNTDLPRYFITLDKEIIWDYPKNFNVKFPEYPYETGIPDISNLIREYINTPKGELLSKHFDNDDFGLINILRVADRRFGKRKFRDLKKKIKNKAALKILEKRINREK